ncbi:Double-strand break repair protein MRE11 [Fragariocoptes setiger]|uniref:Double-strand break repair protein MRE11 n=1 Tax=Fragariocoptes setiger TaxID=1670756 RepID=A0ABQ7S580_9ACAR|nr:Double-strand break repair protein MRE11 [Fragariocoptes setiger]
MSSIDKVFSFLVTTDNHLGYKHDDPVRGQDSFKSFEESLQVAKEKNVDFILLGGDLFHVPRPNLDSMNKCSTIIRKYTFTGEKKHSFTRIGGEFSHEKFKHGNFEDPGYNVACPIFSIHGNHDEPVGSDPLCACQALASNGSLNYFGCFPRKNQEITISPLVLKKGEIKVAIYGLGFLPDALLKRKWERNQVHFATPPENSFTVLVLHQNTNCHGSTSSSYIKDEVVPEFFSLVIRGHEHDALDPIKMMSRDQIVFQPGSTVATSLGHGEALPKRVGIVHVRKSLFTKNPQNPYISEIDLIPLKTCRKILLKDLYWSQTEQYVQRRIDELRHSSPPDIAQYVKDFVCRELDTMLQEYEFENSDPDSSGELNLPPAPLVRIRVEFTDSEQCFGQADFKNDYYPKKVANKDIVLFKRQKVILTDSGERVTTFEDSQGVEDDDYDPLDDFNPEPLVIDRLLNRYFDDKPQDERPRTINFDNFVSGISKDEYQPKYVETHVQARYKYWKKKFEKMIVDEEWAGKNLNDELSIRALIEELLADEMKENMQFNSMFSGGDMDNYLMS